MTKERRIMARMGHPCGGDFLAKPFLAAHPEYAWQEPYLRDMKAGPWTEFRSCQIGKEKDKSQKNAVVDDCEKNIAKGEGAGGAAELIQTSGMPAPGGIPAGIRPLTPRTT